MKAAPLTVRNIKKKRSHLSSQVIGFLPLRVERAKWSSREDIAYQIYNNRSIRGSHPRLADIKNQWIVMFHLFGHKDAKPNSGHLGTLSVKGEEKVFQLKRVHYVWCKKMVINLIVEPLLYIFFCNNNYSSLFWIVVKCVIYKKNRDEEMNNNNNNNISL